MQDAPSAMGSLQPEDEPSLSIAVEAHAGQFQRLDDGGCGGNDLLGHSRVAEPVACGERVGKMQCGAIVRAETCGNTALCPGAGGFSAEHTACQKQHGLRRKR